jgi:hypothetical protein
MANLQVGETIEWRAPSIGVLTCRMVDGVLCLFDGQGRVLDNVRAIQLSQSADDVTTATVTLPVDMDRRPCS